ncbi:P-loop containing nucleoside triphosphate hydrolase protein [Lichtheimia hyalospora FSU 10163]|nr:P-loop containing nucleoside triphosphate hydrolase protein [Lichtheimia hyalospora FSU 10163]
MPPTTRRQQRQQRQDRVNYAESSSDHSDSEDENFDSSDMSEEEATIKKKTPTRSNHWAELQRARAQQRRSQWKAAVTKRKKPTIAPRSIKRLNTIAITPLQRRTQDRSAASTPYEIARERLHVSAVPDSLPCREDEFADIMGFVEGAVESGTGTCIYVAGVPGTGKTATVHEVIRHLQYRVEQKELPAFNFVEINGMKVTDPNQSYSILWQSLNKADNNRRVTSHHALDLLEAKFSTDKPDDMTTVVLMDELDLLVTKKQTVMYNFFEWPNRPNSKLVVVAIANTMDLPERILTNKVSSRLGLTRINFEPYTHRQLYQIVDSRLEGVDAFETEAVEFAARKVSAVSGDARRALDICRRAVEIVEGRYNTTTKPSSSSSSNPVARVTIPTINQAIKEMLQSPFVASVQSYALHQKLFLVSVMHSIRRSGLGEVRFSDVAMYHIRACTWSNIEPPTMSDLMQVCQSLGQARALVIEDGRTDLMMRISLNIATEDIKMGCKDDRLITRLLVNA